MKQFKTGLLAGVAALAAASIVLAGCDKGLSERPDQYTVQNETTQEEVPVAQADDTDSDADAQAGGVLDKAPGDPLEEEGTIGDISYPDVPYHRHQVESRRDATGGVQVEPGCGDHPFAEHADELDGIVDRHPLFGGRMEVQRHRKDPLASPVLFAAHGSRTHDTRI